MARIVNRWLEKFSVIKLISEFLKENQKSDIAQILKQPVNAYIFNKIDRVGHFVERPVCNEDKKRPLFMRIYSQS